MKYNFTPAKNPRVLIIQKVYGQIVNNDQKMVFERHRFKKFIKDVVNGTVERDEVINEELKNHLEKDINMRNLDKVFQVIIKSAIFEFLYKPKTSINIIIKEYLKASNYFIEESQTKYLNALLDKISKKIRISNG